MFNFSRQDYCAKEYTSQGKKYDYIGSYEFICDTTGSAEHLLAAKKQLDDAPDHLKNLLMTEYGVSVETYEDVIHCFLQRVDPSPPMDKDTVICHHLHIYLNTKEAKISDLSILMERMQQLDVTNATTTK